MNITDHVARLAADDTHTTRARTPALFALALAAAAALSGCSASLTQAGVTPTGSSAPAAASVAASGTPAASSQQPAPRRRVVDRMQVDLDADGLVDTVLLRSDRSGAGGPGRVVVRFGSGQRLSARVDTGPNPGFAGFAGTYGDSDVETVVVSSGAGDSATWQLVGVVDGGLSRIETRDESGRPATLTATAETRGWNTMLDGGSFVDYRFRGKLPTGDIAPIDVRRWVMEGTALVRQRVVHAACWIRDDDGVVIAYEPCV